MARIRSIKPEFWTSEQIAECSPIARLLFVGLWNFCDDAGRHPASTKRLKMEVFPGDSFSDMDVAVWISELVKVGLLIEYESQNQSYWQVTGWHHQKIDKPTTKYPPPKDGQIRRPLNDSSNSTPLPIGDSSPPEGKGEEGKGKERKGTPLPPSGEFDDHVERDEPDWMIVEAEFIGRWNALDGVATFHRNSFEGIADLCVPFRRDWRDPGWRERAYAAMAKFPLKHGHPMGLKNFLSSTTIDDILGGVHDFEPGKRSSKSRGSSDATRVRSKTTDEDFAKFANRSAGT